MFRLFQPIAFIFYVFLIGQEGSRVEHRNRFGTSLIWRGGQSSLPAGLRSIPSQTATGFRPLPYRRFLPPPSVTS